MTVLLIPKLSPLSNIPRVIISGMFMACCLLSVLLVLENEVDADLALGICVGLLLGARCGPATSTGMSSKVLFSNIVIAPVDGLGDN